MHNEPSSLEAALADNDVVAALRATCPALLDAASGYWQTSIADGPLSARMTELILLAMHGSSTALNSAGINRHVQRAQTAGATEQDIMDVLFTITAVANHALYFAVPILQDELSAEGINVEQQGKVDLHETKADFIAKRGFWNPAREVLARVLPRYFTALNDVSTRSWTYGSLDPKERELVCIGINCTVTHCYEPGLRLHIRNAIRRGASQDEILHVLQLAAVLGLEGFILGAQALFSGDQPE